MACFLPIIRRGDTEGRDQLDRYYNYPDREMLVETYLSSASWEILSAVDYVAVVMAVGGFCGLLSSREALKIAKPTGRALPK